jgi:hypothetical protein
LAEGDLLSRLPTATSRSFTAVTCAGANLRKGDRVTVEKVGVALVVTFGHSDLARVEQPAPELLDAVAARCNVAPAVIDEVYSLAGMVDVILRPPLATNIRAMLEVSDKSVSCGIPRRRTCR